MNSRNIYKGITEKGSTKILRNFGLHQSLWLRINRISLVLMTILVFSSLLRDIHRNAPRNCSCSYNFVSVHAGYSNSHIIMKLITFFLRSYITINCSKYFETSDLLIFASTIPRKNSQSHNSSTNSSDVSILNIF
jgi:hypothetical protein